MRRDVFQAIADPVRRDIIEILSQQPLSVNAVAEKFAVSRPAISKHLRILAECGLVAFKQKGRVRFCQIRPSQLIPAFVWVDQYRKLWEDKLNSFEEYVNKLQSKNKKK